MFRRSAFVFVISHVMLVGSAFAQYEPATFSPPTPTQFDQIEVRFIIPGCIPRESIVVTGTTIRHTLTLGCAFGFPLIPYTYLTAFGPLPPNSYTYEIYYDFQNGQPAQLRSSQTLTVTAAAQVPALSRAFLAALTLSLTAVALIVLGRTPH